MWWLVAVGTDLTALSSVSLGTKFNWNEVMKNNPIHILLSVLNCLDVFICAFFDDICSINAFYSLLFSNNATILSSKPTCSNTSIQEIVHTLLTNFIICCWSPFSLLFSNSVLLHPYQVIKPPNLPILKWKI